MTTAETTGFEAEIREMFANFAAPFDAEEVKERAGTGRPFRYITARVAMNRLDNVVGPEGWSDEYVPGEKSVLCKLTIKLPDGTLLTKCDAGGYAGMSDEGDDDKSGYSDAFKRACVKFGVARYLYRDGVPEFAHCKFPPDPSKWPGPKRPASRKVEPAVEAAPAATNGKAPQTPVAASPAKDERTCWQLVMDAAKAREDAGRGSYPARDVHWMLVVLAGRNGAEVPPDARPDTTIPLMDRVYAEHRADVRGQLKDFIAGRLTPRPLDCLMAHEREGADPALASEPISLLLARECTEAGRGTKEHAACYLAARAGEAGKIEKFKGVAQADISPSAALLALSLLDSTPEGSAWIAASLRTYLNNHPTRLAPLSS